MAKKKKVNSALIIAILALVINIITASIYIYQASIMREEQHAAVWPHVEWGLHYVQDESFYLEVRNNGVGPALIKDTEMKLNGTIAPSIDSLLVLATGTRSLPHVYGTVDNRVIAPGESIKLINVTDDLWAERLFYKIAHSNKFEYTIAYESIYGQQWISEGYEVRSAD
ncbi:MAG: hypothetical protein R8G66_08405 [Cytophagales bacterium]|nr:hypothetical protein [Cytophagales bacterium]